MAHHIDRRTFLALLAMAGSAAAAPKLPTFSGRKVVVLGAGLAGLAAALQLRNSGYDVTVVEAQDIPGGRVKTIRAPFKNGGYAEAGAVRIYDNHRWTMKYVKQMRLESKLAAYDDDVGAKLWYLQGKRFTTPKGEWPLEGLTAQEKANPFAMIGPYWGPGLQAIGDVLHPDYPAAEARALDRHSMDEFFKKQGASDAWVEIMHAEEADFSRMSALAITAVVGTANDGGHAKTFGLAGGNDQLPKAMAAALGDRVKYNTVVRKLAHDADGSCRDCARCQRSARDRGRSLRLHAALPGPAQDRDHASVLRAQDGGNQPVRSGRRRAGLHANEEPLLAQRSARPTRRAQHDRHGHPGWAHLEHQRTAAGSADGNAACLHARSAGGRVQRGARGPARGSLHCAWCRSSCRSCHPKWQRAT